MHENLTQNGQRSGTKLSVIFALVLGLGFAHAIEAKSPRLPEQHVSKRVYSRPHVSTIVGKDKVRVTDSLVLTEISNEKLRYQLETAGINGHSCSSEGWAVKDQSGLYTYKNVDEMNAEQACVFKFDLSNQKSVSISISGKGCKSLCGLRHKFQAVEIF